LIQFFSLESHIAATSWVRPTTNCWARARLARARNGKGDRAGAVKALEEATPLDPRMPGSNLTLAAWYEEAKDYDKANDR
jgi:Tfp pilus assembly protein PilF